MLLIIYKLSDISGSKQFNNDLYHIDLLCPTVSIALSTSFAALQKIRELDSENEYMTY